MVEQSPSRILNLEMPDCGLPGGLSAREADRRLLSLAPEGFMDTTHFDTIRFPPPPWAKSALLDTLDDGALAYTPYRGNADVLRQVADTTGNFIGIEVDPERNVVLTPGTQGALFCSISSVMGDNGNIALVDPEYLFDQRMVRFLGGSPRYIKLDVSGEKPALDLQALETTFRDENTRAFVFSNPHNPTGAVFPLETLTAIAALAEKYDVTIIVDELYARLIHKPEASVEAGSAIYHHFAALPGMKERTITLLGPSKTESLSGFRLGVAIVPEALIDRVENVLAVTALRAPAYAQHLLVHWLRDDEDWLQQRLPEFTALRDITLARLRELPWLKVQQQEGTAYAWSDVSALDVPSTVVSEALLTQAGVFISPGYQFGPNSNGHFRICYARDERTWELALSRMLEVLSGLAKQSGIGG